MSDRREAIMATMRPKSGECLFVYGSLQSTVHGELGRAERRGMRWCARWIGRATVPGLLCDLGGYPGLLSSARKSRVVHGEVWRIVDGSRLWPALDSYEGLDQKVPEYQREVATARMTGGRTMRAWIYRPVGDLTDVRLLTDMRWCA